MVGGSYEAASRVGGLDGFDAPLFHYAPPTRISQCVAPRNLTTIMGAVQVTMMELSTLGVGGGHATIRQSFSSSTVQHFGHGWCSAISATCGLDASAISSTASCVALNSLETRSRSK